MKILAVRGENLASLADRFELDFEEEPIAGTGLFAITGPTGAGKSTLLDAICLALYDKLPRMAFADNAEIGPTNDDTISRIKAKDVRGILRHGAGSGFAEVDFSGQDGQSYRARWEVKRALGKPNGKLQSQTLSLRQIETGEIIGDKKTDTLDEIQKLIGLDYDQFQRAVMLAQNEFDAFIRAGDKQRAELLERITGTNIYSKISIAVFERNRDEQAALSSLNERLGEHHPLSDEERVDLKKQATAAKSNFEKLVKRRDALNTALTWYNNRDRLKEEINDAAKNRTEAARVDTEAETDRTEFKSVQKAQGLRAEFEAFDKTKKEEVGRSETVRQRSKEEEAAASSYKTAKKEETMSRQKLSDAERTLKEAGPDLDKAGKLDTRIEKSEEDRQETENESASAKKAFHVSEAALDNLKEKESNTAEAVEKSQKWLQEHKTLKWIAEGIDDVTTDIDAYSNVIKEITQSEEAAGDAKKGAESAATDHKKFTDQVKKLEEEIKGHKLSLKPISEQLKGKDLLALKKDLDNLNTLQSTVGYLDKAGKSAGEIDRREKDHVKRLEKARKKNNDAAKAIEKLDPQIEKVEISLEEAEGVYQLFKVTTGEEAERLRGMLEPGKPCPVCGSTEHPEGGGESKFRQAYIDQKDRVANFKKKVGELKEQRTQLLTNKSAAESSIKGAEDEVRKIGAEKIDLIRDWGIMVKTVTEDAPVANMELPSFPSNPLAGDADDHIGPFTAELQNRQEILSQQFNELSDAEARRDEKQNQIDVCSTVLEKARSKAHECKINLANQEGILSIEQAAGVEKKRARGAIGKRLKKLVGITADWKERLIDRPEDFATRCREQAIMWEEQAEVLEKAKQIANGLAKDIKKVEGNLETLKKSKDQASAAYEKNLEALIILKDERGSMFDGRPTGIVRSELNNSRIAAGNAHDRDQERVSKSHSSLSKAKALRKEARHQLASLKEEKEITKKRLDRGLQKAGFTLTDVSERLEKDVEWIKTEEKRLSNIRKNLDDATVALGERTKALKKHIATEAPGEARKDIEGRLEEVSNEFEMASDVRAAVEGKLNQDEEVQKTIKKISSDFKHQKMQADVWRRLYELIGSQKGDKFRTFAQSLTLDSLVGLANEHLKDLVPRFELERSPGGELAIQVIDHDMGDEIRGVHNLSGGEKFLLSLSLALALASISSGKGTRVDSLFIDEGFGSLDNHSLNMAISALEALQATGRKVAVISHVEELKERIGVQVQVTPSGGGRSMVEVRAD